MKMSNYESLAPRTKKVVNRIVRGGVNFLSGTVSPAKSNKETNDIESFAHAMEHYAKRGIKQVVLQPKYMGSRGQVYINRDLGKCYAVSRNGFKINHVDLSQVFKERHNFWFGEELDNNTLEIVIEDGEIMPWRALGDKLVDESFIKYYDTSKNELDTLTALSFDTTVKGTLNEFSGQESRAKDTQNLSELSNCIGQYKLLSKFKYQVDLFATKEEVTFLPFNILKKVYLNGEEEVLMDNNLTNFHAIGKDTQIVVDPSNWDNNTSVNSFLKGIESRELEGCMVKPAIYNRDADRENRCAPYLKVRNKEYLRIVYGPDYTNESKLTKLVEKKSIGRKVGASIKEYMIGHKLLTIPTPMLDSRNEDYKELVAEALISNERNQELDPRL